MPWTRPLKTSENRFDCNIDKHTQKSRDSLYIVNRGSCFKYLDNLLVDSVILDVLYFKLLQLVSGLKDFLLQSLQFCLFAVVASPLLLDLLREDLVLFLESTGLVDQILDIILYFVHLVIDEIHFLLVVLCLLYHPSHVVDLFLVCGLKLVDQPQDGLGFLFVPHLLLLYSSLVMLMDILQSLRQDRDCLWCGWSSWWLPIWVSFSASLVRILFVLVELMSIFLPILVRIGRDMTVVSVEILFLGQMHDLALILRLPFRVIRPLVDALPIFHDSREVLLGSRVIALLHSIIIIHIYIFLLLAWELFENAEKVKKDGIIVTSWRWRWGSSWRGPGGVFT